MHCRKEWFLKAFVPIEETTISLTFHHEMIIKAMMLPNDSWYGSFEKAIEGAFLSFSHQ